MINESIHLIIFNVENNSDVISIFQEKNLHEKTIIIIFPTLYLALEEKKKAYFELRAFLIITDERIGCFASHCVSFCEKNAFNKD